MEKLAKITWSTGDIKGFYIDFGTQAIGYKTKEVHLEFLQCQLLHFMLNIPGGYITTSDITNDPELFSINLSKYISDLKRKILSLIQPQLIEMDPDAIMEQVIEKKTIHGKRGYRLRTELTDILNDDEHEVIIEPVVTEKVPHDFKWYFHHNWLPIFIFIFLIMAINLTVDSLGITSIDIITHIINTPFATMCAELYLLSILPVIAGISIDAPHNFDNSKKHISFFLLCNITGAFTLSALMLYAKSITGLKDSLYDENHTIALFFMVLFAFFVAFYNNYMLQTTISTARDSDHYKLTHAHAFLNTIWLSLSISVGCFTLYSVINFVFDNGRQCLSITSPYVIMLIACYCYMWFSSDSPGAEEIDSVSKNNFVTGAPIIALFSTIITLVCYETTIYCLMSFLINIAFMVVWGMYFIKHRKSEGLKANHFFTSFFNVMSICAIVMLIINLCM